MTLAIEHGQKYYDPFKGLFVTPKVHTIFQQTPPGVHKSEINASVADIFKKEHMQNKDTMNASVRNKRTDPFGDRSFKFVLILMLVVFIYACYRGMNRV